MDPTSLDKLNERIDWELFRETLEESLDYSDGKKGGCPPFNPVMMLKVVVLQRYFDLSEEGKTALDHAKGSGVKRSVMLLTEKFAEFHNIRNKPKS